MSNLKSEIVWHDGLPEGEKRLLVKMESNNIYEGHLCCGELYYEIDGCRVYITTKHFTHWADWPGFPGGEEER